MGPVVANRFCNDVLRIEVQSIFLNRLNANVAENHGKALAFAGAEGEKVQVPRRSERIFEPRSVQHSAFENE